MFLLLHCPRSVGEWPDICVIQAKVAVQCKTYSYGAGALIYQMALAPQYGAFSIGKLDEKSESPLFPGAEGAVTQ